MLNLLFHIGDQAFAVDCQAIYEVIPLIDMQKIPSAIPPVAGFINMGGTLIAVIDFSQLIANRPSVKNLSTRILLFSGEGMSMNKVSFGLIVEKAIETLEGQESDFQPIPPAISPYFFLDALWHRDGKGIQKINISKLQSYLKPLLNTYG